MWLDCKGEGRRIENHSEVSAERVADGGGVYRERDMGEEEEEQVFRLRTDTPLLCTHRHQAMAR